MKVRWQMAMIGWLGAGLLRLLGATLRIEIRDESGLSSGALRGPLIGLFWHNRMLMIPVIWRRMRTGLPTACLTSTSKDGEITARILGRFGFEAIRGSTSRRGVGALIGIHRALKREMAVAIVPDGPRGPRYVLQPGAIRLALDTGCPLVTVAWEVNRYWRLKSWDGFLIPKPFSRLTVKLGPLIRLHGLADDPVQFELLRQRIEQRMLGQLELE